MALATHDNRPLLIYDDACSICRAWVSYWQQLTTGKVRYVPYRDVLDRLPHVPREGLERAIHFLNEDGILSSGAHAAYKVLDHTPGKGYWLGLYRFLPGFAWLAEGIFTFFLIPNPAIQRMGLWLWCRSPAKPAEYQLVSGLFLRLLALIYLVAFISIGVQIMGLSGSEGIFPFAEALRHVQEQQGLERYWFYPTVFWINASDLALQIIPILGCVFAVALFFNHLPRLSLICLFVLYLSLFHAGWIVMNFQWDYLLLEAGFLAIFLPGGSRIVIWLFRWLLFRLRFLSGAAKLISQDPSWSGLTALNVYFETQPLPHLGSWYAHQLPEWMLKLGTGTTLFVELVVPFMIFLPRGPRFIAAGATLALQLLIIATSNHNFLNLLTIALCLFLLDDQALRRVIPARAVLWLSMPPPPDQTRRTWRNTLIGSMAGLLFFAGGFQIWEMLSARPSPEPVATLLEGIKPFRIVNKYHVFPIIKTERMELVIKGSLDGQQWQTYSFKYKPGDPSRRPQLVIPHQPRLDWMMWFIPINHHPVMQRWFEGLLYGLLDNSPAITGLLESNPFPEQPPRYLRIDSYRYRFTDMQTRTTTGQWWEREYLGPFYPLPWLESENPTIYHSDP